MSPLDRLAFDTENLVQYEDRSDKRTWFAPDDDLISLQYHGTAPDIDGNLHDIDHMRACYRQVAYRAGGAMLRADVGRIDGCDVITVLIRLPQRPAGMMYLASLTVPFRRFSYVVKIQCEDFGIADMGSSAVVAELARSSGVSFDTRPGRPANWVASVHEGPFATPQARYRPEEAFPDQRFPLHPLSRARRTLQHIETTLRFSDDLKAEPRFG